MQHLAEGTGSGPEIQVVEPGADGGPRAYLQPSDRLELCVAHEENV